MAPKTPKTKTTHDESSKDKTPDAPKKDKTKARDEALALARQAPKMTKEQRMEKNIKRFGEMAAKAGINGAAISRACLLAGTPNHRDGDTMTMLLFNFVYKTLEEYAAEAVLHNNGNKVLRIKSN